jgi:hypothetical protein
MYRVRRHGYVAAVHDSSAASALGPVVRWPDTADIAIVVTTRTITVAAADVILQNIYFTCAHKIEKTKQNEVMYFLPRIKKEKTAPERPHSLISRIMNNRINIGNGRREEEVCLCLCVTKCLFNRMGGAFVPFTSFCHHRCCPSSPSCALRLPRDRTDRLRCSHQSETCAA